MNVKQLKEFIESYPDEMPICSWYENTGDDVEIDFITVENKDFIASNGKRVEGEFLDFSQMKVMC